MENGNRKTTTEVAGGGYGFDRVRQLIWGTPGFQVRRSTVVSSGLSFLPTTTTVVETVRTDEGWMILLQTVGEEGGQRYILPDKVARALWRHYEGIMAQARKERARRGLETRRSKQPHVGINA